MMTARTPKSLTNVKPTIKAVAAAIAPNASGKSKRVKIGLK